MALSTSGLETWILGLAQAVELATTTDECIPDGSDSDSVIYDPDISNSDEDSAISSDMSIGIDFNQDEESEPEDPITDSQEDNQSSSDTDESLSDVKQRVILALEEFSNTILRKVVELENKAKERQEAKVKSRNSVTTRNRQSSSSRLSFPSVGQYNSNEELPER